MVDDDDAAMPQSVERRAADADRDAVAELLRVAATEGRLAFAELDERLAATYAAKTQAELEAVTADLPTPHTAEDRPLTLRTKSGTLKKLGYWTVPSHITAEATSGTVVLDFTEAVCPHRRIEISAHATSGTIKLIVPYGWGVEMDDATITSGTLRNKVTDRPHPNTPRLRVTGGVRSGTIKARYPRRSFWAWLLRRPRG